MTSTHLLPELDVPRETYAKLVRYVELLASESERQNLIAASTMDQVWDRHILDSAQLLRFAKPQADWIDVGSGAGLPGLVLAILGVRSITLVEPRRLRADFLIRCADALALTNVRVVMDKVDRFSGRADAVTARAVARTSKLLAMTHHLSHPGTVWVLPKGRSGQMELAEAQQSWQGRFRVEPSITQGDAVIIVASDIQRKGRG
ncbi:16S rRNA (guanine(527)-N(7))-methyltransferase RsmG [Sphingomonas sp. BN140010]|uniref:Ribosomal RNA small subunit methyltransferase G n=1 Tax=Sphingomonas arvum TaxID=2992113 RepID=A0ABT3JFE8_9SPHN|nr:16S rRNA (guanine(527)-N(7))-methyltransferase RsmG [Sphingomonas sp. BN140010]MCW3797729.1 16S rRNA (guanine(527)-N(7))-methyltransferase RsmG [Sphingomonas sp. BN140010]